MLKTEFYEILANLENSGIEFKRDNLKPEQLAKEIVALSNFNGGKIFIGVEDDGTITGIQRGNLQEWVMNVFRDKVHPMIIPFYEEVEVESKKRVAVISFPQGIAKPYVVKHNGREDVYIRLGSRSELATREQQARLYSIGGLLHTETMPVSGSSLHSLDRQRIDDYLSNIMGNEGKGSNESDLIRRLCNLGLMIETDPNHMCCTIAGLILFGLRPKTLIRYAGLRVTVYKGTDKEYETILDKTIDECFIGQWNFVSGLRELIRSGIIELFMETIEPFITIEQMTNSVRREKKNKYPIEAIREVIVNAIVHRDWTRSVDIEVALYSDRMEIISPGALQNSMTVEKMKAGQRSHRNPILVEIARDYGYMEARGMGIRKKVLPLIRTYSGKDPLIEETDDYVKITLFPAKYS
ncbi:MAG: RNA-binding domain-containing protein [Candidatus Desantisbacteria bacterium]